MVPGKIELHSVDHEFPKVFGVGVPHPDCPMESGFNGLRIEIVEHIPVALIVRNPGIIGIKDGIGQAASGSHNRHGSVLQANELS